MASADLAAASGLLRGTLDVPAGVQAVLERRCDELGIPAMGLWAQVPHYVSGDPMPFHAGSLALIRELEKVGDLSLPVGNLAQDAEETRQRLDAAVANNPEHLSMLRALEARHDEMLGATATEELEPVSADELAAEVEQFLRDQAD